MIARWDATEPDGILRTDAGHPVLPVVNAYRNRYRQARMIGMSIADSHDEAMSAAKYEARQITEKGER